MSFYEKAVYNDKNQNTEAEKVKLGKIDRSKSMSSNLLEKQIKRNIGEKTKDYFDLIHRSQSQRQKFKFNFV